jgi:hypothetical protein
MKITGFSMITIRLILLQTVIDAVTLGVLANLRGEVSYIPPGNWKVEQPREISEYQPPEIKRFKREAFAPFLEFGNPQTSYHLRVSNGHTRDRINIWNGSTKEQVYIMLNLENNSWIRSAIKPMDTHSAIAKEVLVYCKST